MIVGVAVIGWLVSMPHAALTIWVVAAAGGALYALLTLLRRASARPKAARYPSGWDSTGAAGAAPRVSNLVNTTSEPFSRVGASARWPGVWIGTAVSPPAARRSAAPAAGQQRRRLSVRSAVSMTHQKGRQ